MAPVNLPLMGSRTSCRGLGVGILFVAAACASIGCKRKPVLYRLQLPSSLDIDGQHLVSLRVAGHTSEANRLVPNVNVRVPASEAPSTSPVDVVLRTPCGDKTVTLKPSASRAKSWEDGDRVFALDAEDYPPLTRVYLDPRLPVGGVKIGQLSLPERQGQKSALVFDLRCARTITFGTASSPVPEAILPKTSKEGLAGTATKERTPGVIDTGYYGVANDPQKRDAVLVAAEPTSFFCASQVVYATSNARDPGPPVQGQRLNGGLVYALEQPQYTYVFERPPPEILTRPGTVAMWELGDCFAGVLKPK
jgi:hypothetical protein